MWHDAIRPPGACARRPVLLSRRARTAHACKAQLLSARGAGESATWLDHDAEEAAQARRSNGRRTRCWPYEILWATGTWWQNELFCKHFVNILQMHFVLFLQLFCIFYICFFFYIFSLVFALRVLVCSMCSVSVRKKAFVIDFLFRLIRV